MPSPLAVREFKRRERRAPSPIGQRNSILRDSIISTVTPRQTFTPLKTFPATCACSRPRKKAVPNGTALVIVARLLFLGGLLDLDGCFLALDVGLAAFFVFGFIELLSHKCLYIFSLIAILF